MTRPEPAGAGTAEEREIAAALDGLRNVSAGIKRESRERPAIYVDPKWAFIIDSAHEILASAITAAESRAMERCAKIVEGNMVHGRYREWPSWGPGNRAVTDDTAMLTQALAAAIRSSINGDT